MVDRVLAPYEVWSLTPICLQAWLTVFPWLSRTSAPRSF